MKCHHCGAIDQYYAGEPYRIDDTPDGNACAEAVGNCNICNAEITIMLTELTDPAGDYLAYLDKRAHDEPHNAAFIGRIAGNVRKLETMS